MSGYNLPDGCSQAQVDALLGYESEIELSEAEEYAEYVEKVLAEAHLAPPNIFWECAVPASRRLTAAERARVHQYVDTLQLQDLDWLEEIAAAAWHRLVNADIERDEQDLETELLRKPVRRSLTGRAA